MRTAKFVARKQWVVAGADDMFIRVYNHNTMEKIKSFEAHTDYIRCSAVSVVMVLPCTALCLAMSSLLPCPACASNIVLSICMHLLLLQVNRSAPGAAIHTVVI